MYLLASVTQSGSNSISCFIAFSGVVPRGLKISQNSLEICFQCKDIVHYNRYDISKVKNLCLNFTI